MNHFEYSLETAHPNAHALMKEDFFWSPIEESSPFGSDDGSDAAYGFRQWRNDHPTQSPVIYLKELVEEWESPYFDWSEMDTNKIKEYITSRANVSEEEIQEKMQRLKEALKNSSDTSMKITNDEEIRKIVLSSSQELGGSFLLGQDNAIIGTAFAQFALEGKIDNDIKELATTAIKRQLLPMLINKYDNDYRDTRKEQLTKMLDVITKANYM